MEVGNVQFGVNLDLSNIEKQLKEASSYLENNSLSLDIKSNIKDENLEKHLKDTKLSLNVDLKVDSRIIDNLHKDIQNKLDEYGSFKINTGISAKKSQVKKAYLKLQEYASEYTIKFNSEITSGNNKSIAPNSNNNTSSSSSNSCTNLCDDTKKLFSDNNTKLSASNEQINSRLESIDTTIKSLESISEKINTDILALKQAIEDGSSFKPFIGALNNKIDRIANTNNDIKNLLARGNPELNTNTVQMNVKLDSLAGIASSIEGIAKRLNVNMEATKNTIAGGHFIDPFIKGFTAETDKVLLFIGASVFSLLAGPLLAGIAIIKTTISIATGILGKLFASRKKDKYQKFYNLLEAQTQAISNLNQPLNDILVLTNLEIRTIQSLQAKLESLAMDLSSNDRVVEALNSYLESASFSDKAQDTFKEPYTEGVSASDGIESDIMMASEGYLKDLLATSKESLSSSQDLNTSVDNISNLLASAASGENEAIKTELIDLITSIGPELASNFSEIGISDLLDSSKQELKFIENIDNNIKSISTDVSKYTSIPGEYVLNQTLKKVSGVLDDIASSPGEFILKQSLKNALNKKSKKKKEESPQEDYIDISTDAIAEFNKQIGKVVSTSKSSLDVERQNSKSLKDLIKVTKDGNKIVTLAEKELSISQSIDTTLKNIQSNSPPIKNREASNDNKGLIQNQQIDYENNIKEFLKKTVSLQPNNEGKSKEELKQEQDLVIEKLRLGSSMVNLLNRRPVTAKVMGSSLYSETESLKTFSDLEILKALVQTLDGNEELIKDTLSQTAISLKQTADSIDKTADVYADKTKEGLTNKFEGTDKEKWSSTASLAVEGGRSTVGIAVDRLNTASKVIEGIDIDSNVYKTTLTYLGKLVNSGFYDMLESVDGVNRTLEEFTGFNPGKAVTKGSSGLVGFTLKTAFAAAVMGYVRKKIGFIIDAQRGGGNFVEKQNKRLFSKEAILGRELDPEMTIKRDLEATPSISKTVGYFLIDTAQIIKNTFIDILGFATKYIIPIRPIANKSIETFKNIQEQMADMDYVGKNYKKVEEKAGQYIDRLMAEFSVGNISSSQANVVLKEVSKKTNETIKNMRVLEKDAAKTSGVEITDLSKIKEVQENIFTRIKEAAADLQNVELVVNEDAQKVELYNSIAILKSILDTVQNTQKITANILLVDKHILATLKGINTGDIASVSSPMPFSEGMIEGADIDKISVLLKKLLVLLNKQVNQTASAEGRAIATPAQANENISKPISLFNEDSFKVETSAKSYMESLSDTIAKAGEFATNARAQVGDFINKAKDSTQEKTSKDFDEAIRLLTELTTQKAFIEKVAKTNKDIAKIDPQVKKIKKDGRVKTVGQVLGGFKGGQIQGQINSIQESLVNNFNIQEQLSNRIKKALEEVGKQVSIGFDKGLDYSGIIKIATDYTDKFKTKIESELQIKSPSRWAMNIGSYISEGLAIGIENSSKFIFTTITNIIGEIQNYLKGLEFKIPNLTFNADTVEKFRSSVTIMLGKLSIHTKAFFIDINKHIRQGFARENRFVVTGIAGIISKIQNYLKGLEFKIPDLTFNADTVEKFRNSVTIMLGKLSIHTKAFFIDINNQIRQGFARENRFVVTGIAGIISKIQNYLKGLEFKIPNLTFNADTVENFRNSVTIMLGKLSIHTKAFFIDINNQIRQGFARENRFVVTGIAGIISKIQNYLKGLEFKIPKITIPDLTFNTDTIEKFKRTLQDIPTLFKQLSIHIEAFVVKINEQITKGFINGLDYKKILKVAIVYINKFKAKIEELLEIKSPSKWAMNIGSYIAQGLAIGIEQGNKLIIEPILEIISQIEDYFKSLDIKLPKIEIPELDINIKIIEDARKSLEDISKTFNKVSVDIKKSIDSINDSTSKFRETIGRLVNAFKVLSSTAFRLGRVLVKTVSYVYRITAALTKHFFKLMDLDAETTGIVQKIGKGIEAGLSFLEHPIDTIKSMIDSLVTYINSIDEKIKAPFKPLLKLLNIEKPNSNEEEKSSNNSPSDRPTGVAAFIGNLSKTIDGLYDKAKGIATPIEDFLNKNIPRLKLVVAMLTRLYTSTFDLIKSKFGFKLIINFVFKLYANTFKLLKLVARFTGLNKLLKSIALNIKNNIINSIQNLVYNLTHPLEGFKNLVRGIKETINNIKKLSDIIRSIQAFIESVREKVKSFSATVNQLQSAIVNFYNKITAPIKNVLNFLGVLPKIRSFLNGISPALVELTKKLAALGGPLAKIAKFVGYTIEIGISFLEDPGKTIEKIKDDLVKQSKKVRNEVISNMVGKDIVTEAPTESNFNTRSSDVFNDKYSVPSQESSDVFNDKYSVPSQESFESNTEVGRGPENTHTSNYIPSTGFKGFDNIIDNINKKLNSFRLFISSIGVKVKSLTKASKEFLDTFMYVVKKIGATAKFFATAIINIRRLGAAFGYTKMAFAAMDLDSKTLGLLNKFAKTFFNIDLEKQSVSIVKHLDTIKNSIDGFINYLKSLFKITGDIGLNIDLEEDVKAVNNPLKSIKNKFKSFIRYLKSIPAKAKNIGINIITSLINPIKENIENLPKIITEAIDFIKSLFNKNKEIRLGIDLEEDVESVSTPLNTIKNVFNGFIVHLESLLAKIKDIGVSIVNYLTEGIKERISDIPSVFDLINDEIRKGFDRQNKMIEGIVSSIPGFNIFGNKKKQEKTNKDLINNFKKLITDNRLKNIGGKLGNATSKAIKDSIDAKNIGKDILEGLVQGLSQEEIKDLGYSSAESLQDAIKQELEIQSPSRWAKRIGEYLMEGLKIGIINNSEQVRKASEHIKNAVSENLSDATDEPEKGAKKKWFILEYFEKLKSKLPKNFEDVKNLFAGLVGVIASFSITAFINSQIVSLSKLSFETSVAFDAMANRMSRFVGTTENVDKKIKELRKSSKELGLEQMAVLESYTTLYQTLRNTPLEGSIDSVAKSINKAAEAFSFTTEELKTLYAEINDIAIRGLIDKEAIEGLSKVLPGATTIAAKSLSVSEQELRFLASQNLLSTSTFIPAFRKELDVTSIKVMSSSIRTVQSEINTFKNTLQDMAITIGNSFMPMVKIFFRIVNTGMLDVSNRLEKTLKMLGIRQILLATNGFTKLLTILTLLSTNKWVGLKLKALKTWLITTATKAAKFAFSFAKMQLLITNTLTKIGIALKKFFTVTLLKYVVIVEGIGYAFNTLRTVLGAFDVTKSPLFAKQTVWDTLYLNVKRSTGDIKKELGALEESYKNTGENSRKYLDHQGFFEKAADVIVRALPFIPSDIPSLASMRRDMYLIELEKYVGKIDKELDVSNIINQIGQGYQGKGVLADINDIDKQIAKLTTERTFYSGEARKDLTDQLTELHKQRDALTANFVAFDVGYEQLIDQISKQMDEQKDPEVINRLSAQKRSLENTYNLYKKLQSETGPIRVIHKFSLSLNQLEFDFEAVSQAAEITKRNLEKLITTTRVQDFQTNIFSATDASLTQAVKTLEILEDQYEKTSDKLREIRSSLEFNPKYESVLQKIAEEEKKAGRDFMPADLDSMIKRYEPSGDTDVLNILEAEKQLIQKQIDLDELNLELDKQRLTVLEAREQKAIEILDRQKSVLEYKNRTRELLEQTVLSNMKLQGVDATITDLKQSEIEKENIKRSISNARKLERALKNSYSRGEVSAKEYTSRIEELKMSQKEFQQQLIESEVQLRNAQQQRFFTVIDRSNEQRQADLSIARLKDETKAAIAHADLLKQDLTPAEIEYRKALTDSSLQISSLQNDILAKQNLIAQIVNSGFNTEDTRERLRSLNNEVRQQQAELGKLQFETEQQNATALSSKILDDVDRATQRLQHLSDINVANIELDNLRKYNQGLLDAPSYIAEFNKSMADMQMSVLGVENSLYRAQKALKDLEESEVSTPDSRSKMKELRREIETLEIERAKAIEQQQIDSRNAQSQLFSDHLNEIRSLKEFENNISKIKDQINVNSFGLFGEDLINKKDIENQLKLAKTIKQEIEEGFSQGALSTTQYKEEIRQATTALYDLELQLVNVNKQLFNQKLAELRNVSEFEANIKKVKAQIELASSGVTEDIFQFNTQMLDRDSINSQLEIATRVRGEIEKAFSQGVISVSEYNQEIRQATQQQYDLELQLINIGRQFQTQLEKPIDKINRKLEKQKRLLDNRNNILSEEKALQEAINNTTIARLNKELEVSDKIKSLMDELSSNTLSLMTQQQEKRLRISQKELKSIEDRFYAEEKSLALTREREILENKQEKARVKNDITTQQKLLEAAEKSGNKNAIALYREKVKLANEELKNLIEQDRVNARINSKRRSVLAMNSQSEIQLKQISNQSLVYEQSLERLKYITGDITKQLDKQKNSLQSHKDLTDAIANYRQSLGDIQLQSTNVAKDLISQLKSEDIKQGLKTELESQLSVLGFDTFAKETDLMIDALKMETKLSKDRVNLLKSQQDIARSMLEIDLQRASIEAKQAVVQAKILATWSKAMGISDEDTGSLIADALETAAITQQQGEAARRSLEFNQATEMNRLLTDNFFKELDARRAIAGNEDFTPGSLPRMSNRPELIKLKTEEIKPPKIDLTGFQQSLDNFKIPLEGMNDKLHNEVQVTNSILSNIELAITGQRSIDTTREANRETDNQLKLGYLEEVRKTNNILQETSNNFGEMQKLTKDIVGSDNGLDLKRLGYLVEESINTDPQIEIKDPPVNTKIYQESRKTNTLLEKMSEMMMKTERTNSNNNQSNVNVKEINLVSKDTNADLQKLMSNITMQF